MRGVRILVLGTRGEGHSHRFRCMGGEVRLGLGLLLGLDLAYLIILVTRLDVDRSKMICIINIFSVYKTRLLNIEFYSIYLWSLVIVWRFSGISNLESNTNALVAPDGPGNPSQ